MEVLNKAAFCRWQRLHMMYITFREPQRLYNIQDVPGTVIHHRIKVRKLRRNPPWWQGSQTLYYAKRYGKRSQHSVSPGIIRTAPESSSSVLPTSNRMISPLQTPHLLLTEPSLTRGRHIPYLMATVLILSAEEVLFPDLRNCVQLSDIHRKPCQSRLGVNGSPAQEHLEETRKLQLATAQQGP